MIKRILEFFNNTFVISKYEQVKSLYAKWGYEWNTINIFGVRDKTNQKSDKWNDYICCAMNDEVHVWQGTCDPGVYFTKGGSRKKFGQPGAAHLCLGRHKRMFVFGKHRGYLALTQATNVTVWRDRNENYKNDDNLNIIGLFGINLHHGNDSIRIGKYSAGCQVVRNKMDFYKLLELAKLSRKKYFDYCLFEKKSVPRDILL